MKKDRERNVYGLKEKNLAKTYIKLIPLGMKDPDSIRLLNWKRPTEKNVSNILYARLLMNRTIETCGFFVVESCGGLPDCAL